MNELNGVEREQSVWELHNRFDGADVPWVEFYEAALASYERTGRLEPPLCARAPLGP